MSWFMMKGGKQDEEMGSNLAIQENGQVENVFDKEKQKKVS